MYRRCWAPDHKARRYRRSDQGVLRVNPWTARIYGHGQPVTRFLCCYIWWKQPGNYVLVSTLRILTTRWHSYKPLSVSVQGGSGRSSSFMYWFQWNGCIWDPCSWSQALVEEARFTDHSLIEPRWHIQPGAWNISHRLSLSLRILYYFDRFGRGWDTGQGWPKFWHWPTWKYPGTNAKFRPELAQNLVFQPKFWIFDLFFDLLAMATGAGTRDNQPISAMATPRGTRDGRIDRNSTV